jgi:hypothetical protein
MARYSYRSSVGVEMRKVALALSLVLCGSMASAQTLSELAKKEKERRKTNEKAGKESVVDVSQGRLPEEENARRAAARTPAKKTTTVYRDTAAAREDRAAAIKDLYEKYEAEELRCQEDAARFGVERSDDLPSCREAKRLLSSVRNLRRAR